MVCATHTYIHYTPHSDNLMCTFMNSYAHVMLIWHMLNVQKVEWVKIAAPIIAKALFFNFAHTNIHTQTHTTHTHTQTYTTHKHSCIHTQHIQHIHRQANSKHTLANCKTCDITKLSFPITWIISSLQCASVFSKQNINIHSHIITITDITPTFLSLPLLPTTHHIPHNTHTHNTQKPQKFYNTINNSNNNNSNNNSLLQKWMVRKSVCLSYFLPCTLY